MNNQERKLELESNYLRQHLINLNDIDVVDFGCGNGRLVKELINIHSVHRVYVTDKRKEYVDNIVDEKRIFPLDLTKKYDVVIISHVIEHCNINDFLDLMDLSISLLKHDGLLFVFGPTNHKRFFDDIDHIKPYSVSSIHSMYSVESKNYVCCYNGRMNLKLLNVKYRYNPYSVDYANGIFSFVYRKIGNLIGWILFHIGIHEKVGYMSLWKKVNRS